MQKKGSTLEERSASLNPHYVVHPLEGIKSALSDNVEVTYAKGCHTHKFLPAIPTELFAENNGFKVDFYDGQDFEGSH